MGSFYEEKYPKNGFAKRPSNVVDKVNNSRSYCTYV